MMADRFRIDQANVRGDRQVNPNVLRLWYRFLIAGPPGNYPVGFEFTWPNGNGMRADIPEPFEIPEAGVIELGGELDLADAQPGRYLVRPIVDDVELTQHAFDVS